MKSATRADWKIEPMPDPRRLIPYTRVFDATEHARLTRGIVPKEMEDKWFVFYEVPWLWFHRSWTGFGIYAVKLCVVDAGSTVEDARVNRSPSSTARRTTPTTPRCCCSSWSASCSATTSASWCDRASSPTRRSCPSTQVVDLSSARLRSQEAGAVGAAARRVTDALKPHSPALPMLGAVLVYGTRSLRQMAGLCKERRPARARRHRAVWVRPLSVADLEPRRIGIPQRGRTRSAHGTGAHLVAGSCRRILSRSFYVCSPQRPPSSHAGLSQENMRQGPKRDDQRAKALSRRFVVAKRSSSGWP